MSEFRLFVRAVLSHWLTLMSGGAIIVLVGFYERAAGKNVSWSIYVSLVCVLVVIASFLAWRDKHRELVKEQSEIDRLKQELYEEREPFRREFNAIVARLVASSLVPNIVEALGVLKAFILSHPELLSRADIPDFFVKWIQPYEIHISLGAELGLTSNEYQDLKRDSIKIAANN
jgi:hypothetical protein